MRSLIAACIVVMTIPACQGDGGDPDGTGEWGVVTLVEEIRIGELDGPDEYLFGRIGALAVGPDGAIYVADHQQVSIRKYNASGSYTRDVGRVGEGPGEYRRILGMKCLPDGTLAVLDAPHRIILFSPDGEYLRDFRVPSQLHAPRMLEYDVDGNLYVRAVDADAGEMRTADEWPMVLVKVSQTGEVLGRIPLPRENKSGASFVLMTSEGPTWYPVVSTRHAWSPLGYVVSGRNDTYTITLLHSDSTTTSLGRDVAPEPLAGPERDMWRAWADHFERTRGGGYPPPLDVKPWFKDIYTGKDGTVWVHRHVRAEWRDLPPRPAGDERPLLSWREPVTFDVFEAGGTFLGTVVMPPEALMVVAEDRLVWGIVAGEAGEQVVRWRIQ
jgi:hypothetical protein